MKDEERIPENSNQDRTKKFVDEDKKKFKQSLIEFQQKSLNKNDETQALVEIPEGTKSKNIDDDEDSNVCEIEFSYIGDDILDSSVKYDIETAKKTSNNLATEIINKNNKGDFSPTHITAILDHTHIIRSLKDIKPTTIVKANILFDFNELLNQLQNISNGEMALKELIIDLSKADYIIFQSNTNKEIFIKNAEHLNIDIDENKIDINENLSSKLKKISGEPLNENKRLTNPTKNNNNNNNNTANNKRLIPSV